MGLETATYINDLNSSNPVGSDAASQGDDHIRLLKSTIKATFPNVAGAVTPTHAELNYVDGVTSNIQTQLDALVAEDLTKLPKAGGTMTGDIVLAGAPSNNLHPATKLYVDTADALALPKAGGTMTGDLVLAGAPNADLKAATKKYVDDSIDAAVPPGIRVHAAATFHGIRNTVSYTRSASTVSVNVGTGYPYRAGQRMHIISSTDIGMNDSVQTITSYDSNTGILQFVDATLSGSNGTLNIGCILLWGYNIYYIKRTASATFTVYFIDYEPSLFTRHILMTRSAYLQASSSTDDLDTERDPAFIILKTSTDPDYTHSFDFIVYQVPTLPSP